MTCTRAAIFFDQRARGWQLSVKHGVTSCVIFSLHLATSLLLGWSSYLCSSVVLCSLEICYRSEYVFKMLGVKMIKCRRLQVLRDIHAAQSCKCKQQAASQQYYISILYPHLSTTCSSIVNPLRSRHLHRHRGICS